MAVAPPYLSAPFPAFHDLILFKRISFKINKKKEPESVKTVKVYYFDQKLVFETLLRDKLKPIESARIIVDQLNLQLKKNLILRFAELHA